MSDKVQLIKEEIEKKRQLIWPTNTGEMKVVDTPNQLIQGWLNCLKWIEDFIDSIPEPASEDLEKAAQEYAENHFQDFIETEDDPGYWCSRFGFIAGAEWQHGKDFDDLLQSEMKFPKEFYEKGRFDMREEMMKDAVEGEVVYQIGSAEITPTDIQYKVVSDRVYIPNVKFGDKVKIIIVKTEQQ